MKSRYHFLVSISIALFLIYSGEYVSAFLVMIVGWLIDADHEIDYFILEHKFILNPLQLGNELGGHLFIDNKRRMYIPFHAWEWLIVGYFLGLHPLVLLSYILHLVMDAIGNYTQPQCYSLLWRWKNDWKVKLWIEDCG